MSDWTDAEKAESLIDSLRDIFYRNVHVRRIGEERDESISGRQIERASTSRDSVYRDAADLLGHYRALMDGDSESIRALLEDSVVLPDDNPTRFELYVLFRYIAAIDEMKKGSFEIQNIESGKQLVAELDGDRTINLYHDNSGPDDLSFRKEFLEDSPEPETDEYSEMDKLEKVEILSKRSFTQYMDAEGAEYSGRPDVIVVEVSGGDTSTYLVTEVKYSNRKETIREGIREAHTYRAFLDDGSEETDAFCAEGVLVIDDLDDGENAKERSCDQLEIVQAEEIREQAPEVLQRIVKDKLT